jgi:hypothetical protein
LFDLAKAESNVDAAEVDELLGALTWDVPPMTTWGSLDALTQGGRLSLVESESLRARIAAIHRTKDIFAATESTETEFAENVILPYFRNNAFLPQIALTKSAQNFPGNPALDPIYNLDLGLSETYDHRTLLDDSRFMGILMEKLWIQLDAMNRNNEFIEASKVLIAQLESELNANSQ